MVAAEVGHGAFHVIVHKSTQHFIFGKNSMHAGARSSSVVETEFFSNVYLIKDCLDWNGIFVVRKKNLLVQGE